MLLRVDNARIIKWKQHTKGTTVCVETVFSAMATGSFPEVKLPRRGFDHPIPSTAEVKERKKLHLYSPSGPSKTVLSWNLPSNIFHIYNAQNREQGRDSAVGIVTRYGLNCPGIESQWGRDFPHPSWPAGGPTQPLVKWVQGLSWG